MDSLTQKRSNVSDNCDVTKQCLTSIPSIKLRGHFGKRFREAVRCLCTFNFFYSFPRIRIPNKLIASKWLKKRRLNFVSFDLYVCGWNPSVRPFKWKLLSSTFMCYCFFMLYKVVLTFNSVDETLVGNHSDESYWAVFSCVTVFHAVQGGSNF